VICATPIDLKDLGIAACNEETLFFSFDSSASDEMDPNATALPRVPGTYLVTPSEFIKPRYRFFLDLRPDQVLKGTIRVYHLNAIEEKCVLAKSFLMPSAPNL
jgi:hypothetical protein